MFPSIYGALSLMHVVCRITYQPCCAVVFIHLWTEFKSLKMCSDLMQLASGLGLYLMHLDVKSASSGVIFCCSEESATNLLDIDFSVAG